jgi:xanthine dehydrogenase accessory factor
MDHQHVFQFLVDQIATGRSCVLVTVLSVEGSAMRGPGTHMAVCEDRSFAGSLSGGCIENAVVAEACDALQQGAPRVVRFGSGSPYLDIRLPCGGGLDLHFQPLSDGALARQCHAAIAARQPFSIAIEDGVARFAKGWRNSAFDPDMGTSSFGHWPGLRLVLVGHAAAMVSLARLARSMDIEVLALSPDDRLIAQLKSQNCPVGKLMHTADSTFLKSDPWTAIAFLFHDHEWENALIRAVLALPHFYIGAMGGRQAHAVRCEALKAVGVAATAIQTIHAPIGMFHSSRDPDTLALSILAEIISEYHASDFETVLG